MLISQIITDDNRKYIAWPNIAGWSSLVARQAHNLKVEGSNASPAPTNNMVIWCKVA